MTFPISRPRRLRKSASLRRLLRETRISPASLVEPFFVCPGKNVRQPISAMPGICRFSVDHLLREARESHRLGIPAVLLFGVPREKDPLGKEAYARDGIVPTAVRALKDALPDLTVITDLCFCEYTDHGHCGVVKKSASRGVPLERPPLLRSPLVRRCQASSMRASIACLRIENTRSVALIAATEFSWSSASAQEAHRASIASPTSGAISELVHDSGGTLCSRLASPWRMPARISVTTALTVGFATACL